MTRAEAEARLAGAGWLGRPETQRILGLLDGGGGRSRAVGGIVRDTLLGRERDTNDIDIATELLPQEVMARAKDAGVAAYPTGIEHGTVTLKLDDLLTEVTTLREDVETDGRHAIVSFGTDWRRDAERRDFTLNALYAGADGTLFDPLGGIEDCLAGRVRFIGNPDQRIAEDRLRVYRFFRFSASHGDQRFDPEGLDACRRAAADLGRLSAERVGHEMMRMLALPRVALTLQAMASIGVLAVYGPALELLARYEDCAQPPTGIGRLAIIVAAEDGHAVQERWRLGNRDMRAVERILSATELLSRERVNEAFYRYPDELAEAATFGAVQERWTADKLLAMRRTLSGRRAPKFPLTGADLVELGLRPGEALGKELKRLETMWIESGFTLDRAALLGAASRP